MIGAALGTSETDKIKGKCAFNPTELENWLKIRKYAKREQTERFNNTFNKELDQGIKYYTRKTRNRETDEIIYKHADEAIELATR